MDGKVAVLGDSDFVMPFSALGLDTYPVEQSTEQILESAKKIIEGKYSLIVVAEDKAKIAEQVFGPVQNQSVPAVIVVPFTQEPEGFAMRALGNVLKMATGIDILKS